MADAAPTFDPSQPFDVVGAQPSFDPAKPFDVVQPQSLGQGIANEAVQSPMTGVGQAVSGAGRIIQSVGDVRGMYQPYYSGYANLPNMTPDQVSSYRNQIMTDANLPTLDKQRMVGMISDVQEGQQPLPFDQFASAPNDQRALGQAGQAVIDAGQGITQTAQSTFPVSPENQQTLPVKLTGAVTGIAPIVAAGAVGGPVAIAGLIGAQSYDSAYSEAKAKGASDDDAQQAAAISGLANAAVAELPAHAVSGAIDGLAEGIKGQVMGALAEAGKSGVTMTTFGQLQRLIDNVAANQTYDPSRSTTEGLGNPKDMAFDFAAGAAMGAPGVAVAGARSIGNRAIPPPAELPTVDTTGIREKAAASVPPPTQGDIDSPIPTDLIQEGKAALADDAAVAEANKHLDSAGLPSVDTPVHVDFGDGKLQPGKISDAFAVNNPLSGETLPGVHIQMDDGRKIAETAQTLQNLGVKIIPRDLEAEQAAQEQASRLALPSPADFGRTYGDGFTARDLNASDVEPPTPETLALPKPSTTYGDTFRMGGDLGLNSDMATGEPYKAPVFDITQPHEVVTPAQEPAPLALPWPADKGNRGEGFTFRDPEPPPPGPLALPKPEKTYGDQFTMQATPEAPAPQTFARKDGTPFVTEKSAMLAAQSRADLKSLDLEAVPSKGGFILQEKTPERPAGEQFRPAETVEPPETKAAPEPAAKTSEAPAASEPPAKSSAPVLRADGTPWETEASAKIAMKQRADLKGQAFDVVPVDGGFGLQQKDMVVTARKAPVRTAPMDAATFLADKGGVRDDEGHNLITGRNLQKFVPGEGKLIRPTGMDIDSAGEKLWQAGYFGPADETPRPDLRQVLELLERVGGKDGEKVYSDNDLSEVQRRQDIQDSKEHAKATSDANAAIDRYDADKGLNLTDAERAAALENIQRGHDPHDAVDMAMEDSSLYGEHGSHDAANDASDAGESRYADTPNDIPRAPETGDGASGSGEESKVPDAGGAEGGIEARGQSVEDQPVEGQGLPGVEPAKDLRDKSIAEAIDAKAETPQQAALRAKIEADRQEMELKAQQTKLGRTDQKGVDTQKGGLFEQKTKDLLGDDVPFQRTEGSGATGKKSFAEMQAWAAAFKKEHGQPDPDILKKINKELDRNGDDDIPFQRAEGSAPDTIGMDREDIGGGATAYSDPATRADRNIAQMKLNGLVRGIAGDGAARVKVVDHIGTPEGGIAEGAFIKRNNTIYVSHADIERMAGTTHHEVIHFLRQSGALDGKTWDALSDTAQREWRDRYGVDRTYAPDIAAWRERGLPEDWINDRLNEEAVAHAATDYAEGKLQPTGIVGRALDIVKRAVEMFRNIAAGRGATTAKGILSDLQSGRMVDRRAENIAGQHAPAFAREVAEKEKEATTSSVWDKASGAIARKASELDKTIEAGRLGDRYKTAKVTIDAGRNFMGAIIDDVKMFATPMAVSSASDRARAVAKDFANSIRRAYWQTGQYDARLKMQFSPEDRKTMWETLDRASVEAQKAVDAGSTRFDAMQAGRRVLDDLPPKQRAVVDEMTQYAEGLWQKAVDAGMVEGKGLPLWTPRMAVMVGEDGTFAPLRGEEKDGHGAPTLDQLGRNLTTSSSNLKGRKYMTADETEAAMKKVNPTAELVRDIRTMPLAMGRLERAIAGKELVNSIQKIGKIVGMETTSTGMKPGFFTLDHPAMQTYRPKTETSPVSEAFDEHLWKGLQSFAKDIGVDPERVAKMPDGSPRNSWGAAGRDGSTFTKFGGPESVLTHELGHQLDFKYGLTDLLTKRGATAKELRALADLRYAGHDVSDAYKAYVRKGTEKIANMVHAYVHAPEMFKEVAPQTWKAFNGFLNQHPELSGLKDIKPSLVLGTRSMDVPHTEWEKTPIYISKEFEGPLRSVLTSKPSGIYAGLMALKGKSMGMIMYSPLIHNAVEFGRALPKMLPGMGSSIRVYSDGAKALADPETMREGIAAGLAPIGHRGFNQDISSIQEEPNLKPGRSWTAKSLGAIGDMVGKGDAVRSAVDSAGDFWHNTLLWDQVAKLQAGLYVNMRDHYIEKGLPEGAAQALAAHEANRYAGALPAEAMGEQARRLANLTMFSRTFTIGNLGVMKDMLTGLPKDVKAQLSRDFGPDVTKTATSMARASAIKTVGLDVGLMMAGNALLQTAANSVMGQSLDDQGKALARRIHNLAFAHDGSVSGMLGSILADNALSPTADNEPRYTARIKVGHDEQGTAIYARSPLGKIGEEFHNWATSPFQTAKNKLSTLVRPVIDTAMNDKGFGPGHAAVPVYNPNDNTLKIAGAIAYHFMESQEPTDSIKAAWDAGKAFANGQSPKAMDVLKTVGPLAGVTFSHGTKGGEAVGEYYAAKDRQELAKSLAIPEINEKLKAAAATPGSFNDKANSPVAQEAIKQMATLGMDKQEILARLRGQFSPGMTPGKMNTFNRIATPEEQSRMNAARGQ